MEEEELVGCYIVYIDQCNIPFILGEDPENAE